MMAADTHRTQFQQSADISRTIKTGSIRKNESFDPITAEVIRSSFDNIARAMSLVLLRTYGSAVLTESKDFSTILFDAECNQLGVVGYLLYHLALSVWCGENKNGDPSVFLPLDSGVGVGVGGGAQSIGDGQDNYGLQATLSLNWADVEVYELSDPVLLLWRRIKINAGGAGRYRGGMGMDAAFTVREGQTLVGQTFLTATEIPGKGFAGGYPGSLCTSWVLRDTNIREVIKGGGLPKNQDMLTGETDPNLRANTTNIHFGEVMYFERWVQAVAV